MTKKKVVRIPPPPDWRKLPRAKHTRELEALEPGQSYIASARMATTCRMWASRAGKRPGRKYHTRLTPDRSGRVEIYREA